MLSVFVSVVDFVQRPWGGEHVTLNVLSDKIVEANFQYTQSSLTQLKNANVNLVAQNKALNAHILILNDKIDTLCSRLTDTEQQILLCNKNITDDNKKITDHYTEQTTKLTETKTEMLTKIEEVKTNIITNNTSIENLKNQITELGEKIAGILESTKSFVRRTSGQFARMVGMTKTLGDDYKFGEIEDTKN